MITCHHVFNLWPKITFLPLWPRDPKRLDTPVFARSDNVIITSEAIALLPYIEEPKGENPITWRQQSRGGKACGFWITLLTVTTIMEQPTIDSYCIS